ncbi:MAG: citramalate synthase [Chloroflexi bacterium]|nr:citramalate synthase [Chloroflexota bacterium]
MTRVEIYDTTLRDGAQMEGISFSVEDKLKIAKKLDELGVHYIEGGWPGSNPKDAEFFARAQNLSLSNSVIAAFGSTRRPNIRAESDSNLKSLLDAKTKVVTLVGKSWDFHVTHVLETTLEENLSMVSDSIRYLKSQGRTVFFDAEHFFDGFHANPEYALAAVRAAADAGADCVVLCDTNGGSLPQGITAAIETVKKSMAVPLGIHTHNDGELAVANSIAAVQAGAIQVQGTINGYGERCGNANLCSVIANLKLKLGIDCLPEGKLARLTDVSRYVSEIANLPPSAFQPYVGASAFSHKGGLHASAVAKAEQSYQHIEPSLVGNTKRVVVSELSGRANIIYKAKELGIDASLLQGEKARKLLEHIKTQESQGFQYEGAEASFELLVRRIQPDYKPPFELVDFMVMVEKRRRAPTVEEEGEMLAEAMVKVKVGSDTIHTAAEGNGPVNALDGALRKALLQFYPSLAAVKLIDYKVRIIDETEGTRAKVRVLIESTDGERQWRTVGSSTNIIEASWLALADSLEYWLTRRAKGS